MKDSELIALAKKARQRAYAPYSQHTVGAALLTASGRVYSGCNVENASYGLTICAERTAVVTAVCDGQRDFVAIAVASEHGVTPCGACRQVLSEFGPGMRVIVAAADGSYHEYSLPELLPDHFGPSQLPPKDDRAY